jgi:hypothetical protein
MKLCTFLALFTVVTEYLFALNTARRLTPALCPQTVDLTARLPGTESSNLKSATIRVLVVDPEGLVTIYSPVSPIQSVAPAVTLGSDVSNKVISKVMAGHRKKINTEVAPTTTKSPSAVSTPQHCGAILYLTTDNFSFIFLSVSFIRTDC